MTDQQIIDNILIAEFMEFELSIISKCYHCTFIEFLSIVPPIDMKFNTDWNWLMPVIEKIPLKIVIQSTETRIYYPTITQTFNRSRSMLLNTYNATVAFIKCYKQGK